MSGRASPPSTLMTKRAWGGKGKRASPPLYTNDKKSMGG